MLPAVLDAWAALAAAAWPWAALTAALLWLAALTAARTVQASDKSYSNETRIGALETWSQPFAVQPGSVPALPETWHDFPSGVNGWGITGGGWKKYRLTAGGDLEVSICLTLIGTKTDGTRVFADGTLPAGYAPNSALRVPVAYTAAQAPGANSSPWMGFLVAGGVIISGVNLTGLDEVHCHAVIPRAT